MKKLISFEDDFAAVAKYQMLGFNCEVDDAANNIICCEFDLSDADGLALLAVCEDCKREGLNPMVIIADKCYAFAEGLKAADEFAAAELAAAKN